MNTIFNSHPSELKSRTFTLEWVLLIVNSLLLGIWAVKDTIALRNILLATASILTCYYISQELKFGSLKKQLGYWNLAPLFVLLLIFFWVIAHYFFFSINLVAQLNELRSTWFRAFLATIVGLGVGLALRNYPKRLGLLWLGMFISFLVLFFQYLPRAIEQQKLLVTDYEHYLFHLKFNTVLVGLILFAGLTGGLADYLLSIRCQFGRYTKLYLTYWIIGIIIILWTFVYIVDSRNGIGLFTIFYLFWFAIVILQNKKFIQRFNLKNSIAIPIGIAGLVTIIFFIFAQMKINIGWITLIDDARVAVQVEKYKNWQNLELFGYPFNDNGHKVTGNNYERIAWAVVGFRAALNYPQGMGILEYSLAEHPGIQSDIIYEKSTKRISTHSAWIDLFLAFGLPFIALTFSVIALIFIAVIRNSCSAKFTVLSLSTIIFFLYTTTEISAKHGIEILFYLLAFLTGLFFLDSQNSL